MTDTLLPRRELGFQLFELLRLDDWLRQRRFAEHDRATLETVIDTAYDIAAERFAPYAQVVGVDEPRLVDGGV